MAEFLTPVKSKNNEETSDKLVIPPSPFLNRLGYGTGVSVMQLRRSPKAGEIRSPWALKMLNRHVKPKTVYSERLRIEAALLCRMSHPNIVGFRAFNDRKRIYLGMEACDVSLGDMIEKRAEEDMAPFSSWHILKVASDIGNALDYLHTKMQILHGDIKSYNILVNGDFVVCKLCDFGVTLPLNEDGVFDKAKAGPKVIYYGTLPWSAPEVINESEISHKTDIFSFGLVFWEMMALMAPHTDIISDLTDSSLTDSSINEEMIEESLISKYGTRPSIPVSISEEVYADPLTLFACCTENIPSDRPTAHQIMSCANDMIAGHSKPCE